MNPDNDLREPFARQRRSDHEQAPAWNPGLLRAPARPVRRHMPVWLPLTATATACALLSFVWLRDDGKPSADLTGALPELFTTHGEPLFASLGTASNATPSDSFLPVHLTIQLP